MEVKDMHIFYSGKIFFLRRNSLFHTLKRFKKNFLLPRVLRLLSTRLLLYELSLSIEEKQQQFHW
jgi:hypothetical protein